MLQDLRPRNWPSRWALPLLAAPSLAIILAIPFEAPAQGRAITGGGGSADVGIRTLPPAPAQIIRETAVTPMRAWKNAEGKVITAMLLAHRIEGQQPDDPPVIVKDGKVRLLKDKKSFEIELATLSREDRNYIDELVFAIQEREEQMGREKAGPADTRAEDAGPKKE